MKSDRISLINCDERLLKIILKGDEYLAEELGIKIPIQWSEFGKEIFKYTLNKIKERPSEFKWYSYLPIENKTKTLLGSCGYKGEPDNNGLVEIGYEVAKNYRNKGYATEISKLLVENAFTYKKVKKIEAHTLAERNASVRVLEKCKFRFVKEYYDKEDGLIWKWIIEK